MKIETTNKEWVKTRQRPYGCPCTQHRIDKSFSVFGHKGQIYYYSSGLFTVVIWAHVSINLVIKGALPESVRREKRGDEINFQISKDALPIWLQLLRVPKDSGRQAALANNRDYLR